MKERPISFRGDMVRSILKGNKTQTRRIMKVQPEFSNTPDSPVPFRSPFQDSRGTIHRSPYGIAGDRLWVRENWQAWQEYDHLAPSEMLENPNGIVYLADRWDEKAWDSRFRHARFMPRWASRLTLEVVAVRAEMLHSIRDNDALAEGITHTTSDGSPASQLAMSSFVTGFRELWKEINGSESWEANPWVWVVEFKVVPQDGPS